MALGRPLTDPAIRFWRYVDIGDCWEWTGGKTWDGYGRFRLPNKTVKAHRFAYKLLVGEYPEGLQPDHLCKNRGCVNPDHLQWVTLKENLRRGIGYGRKKFTNYVRPKANA